MGPFEQQKTATDGARKIEGPARDPAASRRVGFRCSAAYEAWLDRYADHVQLTLSSLLTQATTSLAERTGYAQADPPPRRVPGRTDSGGRPMGPWPERSAN